MPDKRIHSVDILRGLLSVGVMLHHYSYWLPLNLPQPFLSISQKVGIYAVESFFVLSGFSLYWAHRSRPPVDVGSFTQYIAGRLFRLAPLFILAIFLSKSIQLDQIALGQQLANFTLTLGFVDPALSLIVGGWSIGVEMVLSSFLPLLVVLQARMNNGFLAVVAASCVTLFFWQGEASYPQAPNHLLFFVAGVYLGHLRSSGVLIRSSLPFWAALLAGCAVFCAIYPGGKTWVEYVQGAPRAALTAATIVISGLFCLYDFSRVRMLFGGATLLGKASYSVYLLHPLVFDRLSGRFGPIPPLWMLGVCVAATIVISIPVYFQFERRAQKLLGLLFKRAVRSHA